MAEEKRIKIYYAGLRLGRSDDKTYSYWSHEDNDFLNFSKKLVNTYIGSVVEVTRTDTGVKGPYTSLFGEPKHKLAAEWYAIDASNRKIVQIKAQAAKNPELIDRFEILLKNLTFGMTRTQKQLFLMKYLLEIK